MPPWLPWTPLEIILLLGTVMMIIATVVSIVSTFVRRDRPSTILPAPPLSTLEEISKTELMITRFMMNTYFGLVRDRSDRIKQDEAEIEEILLSFPNLPGAQYLLGILHEAQQAGTLPPILADQPDRSKMLGAIEEVVSALTNRQSP